MSKTTINPFTGQPDLLGGGASLSIGASIAGASVNSVLVTDSGPSLQDIGTMTNGQLVIGSTGNTPVRASLTGTTNQITVTPGAGSITLSLPQDINTTATPTFTTVIADVDKTGTVNIGGTNATTVNIGNSTSGASVLGTLNLNTHLITNVVDPVSPQDASTKKYTDDSISALSLVYIPLTQKAANNGVATLDSGGKIPASQLPNSVMEFKGVYDPNTNTPALANGTGNTGDTYVANAGSHDFGAGSITFADGDYVVYNGSIYQKSINSNNIASVNGQQGVVVLDTDDISEGVTNLYYLDSRVSSYLTGAVSTITTSNLTVSRALASDASGKVAVSATTSTELGYVSGVTSAIQTQLNGKASTALDNLASTAVNVSILPGVTNTIDLGSATKQYNDLYVNHIKHSGIGTSEINMSLAALMESGGFSLDWAARKLYNTANEVINYATTGLVTFKNANVEIRANSSDTATSELRFRELNSNGSNYIALKAPLALASDVSYTLPTDGTSGQVLSTNGSGVLSFIDSNISAGDLKETSFSAADGQAVAANVTGFAFANASVRSFKAQVSVYVDATTSLYETFDIMGIQKGASWEISQATTGDDSLITFTITNAGQIQYTSATYPGFVSATVKFRATATSV